MSVFTNPSSGAAEQAAAYVNAIHGLLGSQDPMSVLRATPAALGRAIDGVPAAKLKQREMAGKWSIGQVLQHLADSEVVWAWRMRLILAQDRPTITGYDQDQWADNLHYDEAEPAESSENLRSCAGGTSGSSSERHRRTCSAWASTSSAERKASSSCAGCMLVTI